MNTFAQQQQVDTEDDQANGAGIGNKGRGVLGIAANVKPPTYHG